jgi:hypothetical protein
MLHEVRVAKRDDETHYDVRYVRYPELLVIDSIHARWGPSWRAPYRTLAFKATRGAHQKAIVTSDRRVHMPQSEAKRDAAVDSFE